MWQMLDQGLPSSTELPMTRPDPTTYIGGSDAPVLMGASQYSTVCELWRRFTGVDSFPVVDNEPARWGLMLEPFVGQEFARAMNLTVEDAVFEMHPEHDFVGGHPDFNIVEPHPIYGKQILETKTSMSRNYDSDSLPAGVYWQCQHYNLITGAGACHVYVALLDVREFKHYIVEAIPEDFENMIKAYKTFWYCVHNDIAPEPKVSSDLILMHPEPVDEVLEANDYIRACVEELEKVKAELGPLEKAKKDLEEKLKMSFGKHSKIRLDDRSSVSWKPCKSTRFDQAAFKQTHPSLYEEFLTEGSYRRLSINHRKARS